MSEKIMRDNLLVLAQTYANERRLSLATVSKEIHGNQAFLKEFCIEGKISVRIDTYYTILNKLRAKWPRGLAWPKTSPLPKLGKKIDEGFVRG